VGDRLRSVTRAEDTVARIGGDEFVALFVGLSGPSAVDALAEKVIAAMREPFHVAGMRVFATASMGVALNDPPTVSEADLLANADAAMYAVKMTMRNSWALFSPDMHTAAMAEYDVAGEMKAALQSGQMIVHYQPQVELETGKVLAVEALVRWNHPKRGMLDAAEFMTRAEESGLVIPLGEFVLQSACRQHRQWEAEGLGRIRIAVNVSYQEVSQPTYADVVRSIITDVGVDPSYLELEVPELDIIRADAAMRRTFDRLHHMGVRLAVDDFGRGYASLGHLHDFPIDTLKVDRSHTSRSGDPVHDALAAASLVLATGLAVDTVAECAETAEQLQALRPGPYHAVQGYVFGRPVPPGELTAILRDGYRMPPDGADSDGRTG
jgi:predicted signal transduction protein with EAL and GGDEF domain